MTSIMTLPNFMTGFLYELGPSSGVYSFVSYPSAISPTQRSKYRNESATSNVMHDRRVVRGNSNTYAKKVPLRNVVTATNETRDQRIRDSERRSHMRRQMLPNIDGRVSSTTGYNRPRATEVERLSSASLTQMMPETKQLSAQVRVRKRVTGFQRISPRSRNNVPMREGRQHCQTQTEKWPVEDKVPIGVQTDQNFEPLLAMPNQKYYKNGPDKSTQILPDDPDLFAFDDEVVLLLDALVAKTLERGLLEVISEEEKASIAKQKVSSQERMMVLHCM